MGSKKKAKATWSKLLKAGVDPGLLLAHWREFLALTEARYVPAAELTIRNKLSDDEMHALRIRAGVKPATSGTRRVLQENATRRSDAVKQGHRDARAQWEAENPELARDREANETAQAEREASLIRERVAGGRSRIPKTEAVGGLSGGRK